MKRLLFLSGIILLFAYNARSQEVTPLSFERVIKVDSVNKTDIYSALITWIGINYKSSKHVLEMENQDIGLIIVNANIPYKTSGLKYKYYSGYINYKMQIQIRDNRFKVTMINFNHESIKPRGSLGLLTTKEKREKALNIGSLKVDNDIWNDTKQKSKEYSEMMFKQLSEINFKQKSQSAAEDW